ncbi:MAG: SiaB family protein kinase [Bacteroidales bacterium]|nr:SiaB family protein kinase [Bacteroidales bacterium]
MHFNFDEYYNKLNDDGEVILAYHGTITADGINGVLEAVESKLDGMGIDPKVKKKVYNVLVEGLQNLYHHIDELPQDFAPQFAHKFGVVVVRKKEECIKITLGNFINVKKTAYLKDKIDKINSLSEDELKDMYKFILNHQKLSVKGGGGLGLLDMARKSGNKLGYEFFEFNSDYQFFSLDITINYV